MSEAVELDGVRARRFAPRDAELEGLVPTWLRSGDVAEGEVLRAGRVWRWRDYAIKRFPARGTLSALRASRALRCARVHSEILPVRSPRPILATEDAAGASLLVYEFVAGEQMKHLWDSDAEARARFPEFLAEMHVRGVYHGDFHLDQALWDGAHWYLIDLEGIRHRLRNFLPRRLVEGHWSRVSFGLAFHCDASPAAIRALFDAYVAASRLDDSDELWRRVEKRVEGHWDEWKRHSRDREAATP